VHHFNEEVGGFNILFDKIEYFFQKNSVDLDYSSYDIMIEVASAFFVLIKTHMYRCWRQCRLHVVPPVHPPAR
jgi:hypothetical protein